MQESSGPCESGPVAPLKRLLNGRLADTNWQTGRPQTSRLADWQTTSGDQNTPLVRKRTVADIYIYGYFVMSVHVWLTPFFVLLVICPISPR